MKKRKIDVDKEIEYCYSQCRYTQAFSQPVGWKLFRSPDDLRSCRKRENNPKQRNRKRIYK